MVDPDGLPLLQALCALPAKDCELHHLIPHVVLKARGLFSLRSDDIRRRIELWAEFTFLVSRQATIQQAQADPENDAHDVRYTVV